MAAAPASGLGSRCPAIEPCSHAETAAVLGSSAAFWWRMAVQPLVASRTKTTMTARAALPGEVRSCAMTRSQYQPRDRGEEGAPRRSSKTFTAGHHRRLWRLPVNAVTQITYKRVEIAPL